MVPSAARILSSSLTGIMLQRNITRLAGGALQEFLLRCSKNKSASSSPLPRGTLDKSERIGCRVFPCWIR